MNIRVASAIFGLLLLAVAVGWCALPDIPTTAAPTTTVYVETLHTAPEGSAVSTSAVIIGGLVSGAAMIGLMFFSPATPRGPRWQGALSANAVGSTDFVSTWVTHRVHPARDRHPTVGRRRRHRGARVWPEDAERRDWLMFFSPQTPKGPRGSEALSAVQLRNSFVECARRGLADLHQELEVVLGLLQPIDQQIDRLVRVQAGQYAAQLVQHRRLVGAEQ